MEESRFRWEEKFQHTWDDRKMQKLTGALSVTRRTETMQRGIVRKILVILDMSASIDERDFLPSRKWHMRNAVVSFYRSFTENNPLSTLGLMIVCNGVPYLVTSIISDEETIVQSIGKAECAGKFSLTAALESASVFFQNSAFLKEIVLVVSSLSFVGKSPYQAVNVIISKGVKIHTVHFCAEMEILKTISRESEGLFGVVERPDDLGVILDQISVPSPHTVQSRLAMLQVGFPKCIKETSICACHLEITQEGYECPFCTTKVCTVPGVCPICEGILSAPVHLLKALHWTDSAPEFVNKGAGVCKVCEKQYSSTQECPECSTLVCVGCSKFMRQELNFCIYCKEKETESETRQ